MLREALKYSLANEQISVRFLMRKDYCEIKEVKGIKLRHEMNLSTAIIL